MPYVLVLSSQAAPSLKTRRRALPSSWPAKTSAPPPATEGLARWPLSVEPVVKIPLDYLGDSFNLAGELPRKFLSQRRVQLLPLLV